MPNIIEYVAGIGATPIAPWAGVQPDELTAAAVVEEPGAELKSSFVFADSTLAHFNFVGDSILGSDVNLEAGAVVCNHRNEHGAAGLPATARKFGALVGDGSRIGANAVLAPGTLLRPNSIVGRLELVDQQRR